MSWQTPKTDWGAGDLVTYTDMNRIGGNLNYLLDSNTLRTDFTDADYVYLTDWQDIIDAVEDVQDFLGMDHILPSTSVTSYNFNLVETFCADAKPQVDLIRAQRYANKYAGPWYTDTEIYAGGME